MYLKLIILLFISGVHFSCRPIHKNSSVIQNTEYAKDLMSIDTMLQMDKDLLFELCSKHLLFVKIASAEGQYLISPDETDPYLLDVHAMELKLAAKLFRGIMLPAAVNWHANLESLKRTCRDLPGIPEFDLGGSITVATVLDGPCDGDSRLDVSTLHHQNGLIAKQDQIMAGVDFPELKSLLGKREFHLPSELNHIVELVFQLGPKFRLIEEEPWAS